MSAGGGSILVVDVGTSGVRAAVVRPDATVEHEHRIPLLPDSPAPGLVEFDAARMAGAILEVAHAALADGGPVAGVGIANQRASCGNARPESPSRPVSAGRIYAPSGPAWSFRRRGSGWHPMRPPPR